MRVSPGTYFTDLHTISGQIRHFSLPANETQTRPGVRHHLELCSVLDPLAFSYPRLLSLSHPRHESLLIRNCHCGRTRLHNYSLRANLTRPYSHTRARPQQTLLLSCGDDERQFLALQKTRFQIFTLHFPISRKLTDCVTSLGVEMSVNAAVDGSETRTIVELRKMEENRTTDAHSCPSRRLFSLRSRSVHTAAERPWEISYERVCS